MAQYAAYSTITKIKYYPSRLTQSRARFRVAVQSSHHDVGAYGSVDNVGYVTDYFRASGFIPLSGTEGHEENIH